MPQIFVLSGIDGGNYKILKKLRYTAVFFKIFGLDNRAQQDLQLSIFYLIYCFVDCGSRFSTALFC